MNTPAPMPGFAPAPVNSAAWNAQTIQAAAEAQKQATMYRARPGDTSILSWVPDWISKPVEWAGSGLHWAYTNVISRPLSTVMLAGYMSSAEAHNNAESWSNIFSDDIWDRAYTESKHVSPGQAFEFGIEHFGEGQEELRKSLAAPVMFTPKDAAGNDVKDRQGKTVKVNLNQSGYLWDNPDAVKVHFDSGAQKWISGGVDFAVSWYADPLVLAGKGAGALRQMAYVRPGSTFEQVSKNLQSSAFTSFGDRIMQQKTKLGPAFGPSLPGESLPGSKFEDWVTNQAWAKNSSDAGALAAALGRAADRSEVDQILAISMGDKGALQTLTAKNAELGAQLKMLDRQREGLVSSFPANPTADQATKQAMQLDAIADDVSKIESQTGWIGRKLSLENSMKNGMYFNPTLSPMLSDWGQYGRGLELAQKGSMRPSLALAYNNFYVRPVRVLTGTTWRGVRAPGHIDINDELAHKALDANMDQARVWSPDERRDIVSTFIQADEANKGLLINEVDRQTFSRIAQKYGLSDNEANLLYKNLGGMKAQARNGRVYSTAYIDTADGGRLRADHVADDGSLVAISPVLNSQLENTHILTDYEHADRVLKTAGPAFKKLLRENEGRIRGESQGPLSVEEASQAASKAMEEVPGALPVKAMNAMDVGKDVADLMSRIWKFQALFRLGYGPRAIADDFMGQAARFGAANLMIDRMAKGTRNLNIRTWNKVFNDPTNIEQQLTSIGSGIDVLTARSAKFQQKIEEIQSYLPPAMDYTGRGAKGRRQFNQRSSLLQEYQGKLADTEKQLEALKAQHNKVGNLRNELGDNYVIMPDGTAFPRPFEGPTGALFKDLNAGRRTIDSVMGGTASSLWNAYRTGSWDIVTAAEGDRYYNAWLRDVQHQIASDPAAMAAVRGDDMEKFFRSPQGREYFRNSGLKSIGTAELADRIQAHVDHYLPVSSAEGAALRQAVANGADDATIAKLMKDVKADHTPDVQSEGLAYAMGKSDSFRHIDNMMDKFFDRMGTLPSEVLSRNPLFFQLYRQHVSDMWQVAKDSGYGKLTPQHQQRIADQARKLALKDVKKFTFNMDFESKLAFNMRFISPFFGPMQESFNRWGRIVADKPDVLSHAAQVFTSPIRAGHAVDRNGNPVDEDGYAIGEDGKKYLVPKSEMHLQFQAPQWLAKSIGMDQGSIIDMPIDTFNLVLQNDPWFNPGTGPWVQLPANWVALKGDPSIGDAMKDLGIVQRVTPSGWDQVLGTTLKSISPDDGDQQQKDMAYLMQSEDYKWKTGMRDTQPTWQEIKDRVGHMSQLRSFMKFTLPVSADFKDPYQFFRDRYGELQRANPKTADQIFLAKYGDAAFAFTGALTKSAKGLPATVEAVRADKKFSYLTDADPDMAQLIVGPYAAGQFSQTAFAQQKASGERKQIDAVDSFNSAQLNQGWAQFNKYMTVLKANLYQAGFTSFDQPGAQKFNDKRKRIIMGLTSPTLRDGSDNPYYNEQFSRDFNTIDMNKDDRKAAAMNRLVTEKALVEDPMRQDIRGLANYMVYRNAAKAVLAARDKAGGSADINAKANGDIKRGFHDAVMQLVEGNTMFESLHDRFLVRDMFDHYDPALGGR